MKNERKKMIYIACIIAVIAIIMIIILITIYKTSGPAVGNMMKIGDNMSRTRNAIIVKVNENSLGVIEPNSVDYYMFYVNFAKEGDIGFKKGQEILIYYNGDIQFGSINTLYDVGKIEIVKEQSDIEIPDEAIKAYYNTTDKVSIEINQLTNTQLDFTITDTNELIFDYSKKYRIYKNTEAGEEENIEELLGTENSLPSNMRVSNGFGKELNRSSNIKEEDISGYIETNGNISKCSYNWEDIYGKLGERRI